MRKLSLWLIISVLTFCIGVGASFIFNLAPEPDCEAVSLPHPDYQAMSLPQKSCEMHGAEMRREKIPVVYGMQIRVVGYSRARDEFFPHAISSVNGGCIMGRSKHVEAWICPKCREARLAWVKAHSGLRVEEIAE